MRSSSSLPEVRKHTVSMSLEVPGPPAENARERALYMDALAAASLPTVSYATRTQLPLVERLKLGASTVDEAEERAHVVPRGKPHTGSRTKLKHFVAARRKRLGQAADIAPDPAEVEAGRSLRSTFPPIISLPSSDFI